MEEESDEEVELNLGENVENAEQLLEEEVADNDRYKNNV